MFEALTLLVTRLRLIALLISLSGVAVAQINFVQANSAVSGLVRF